MKIFNYESNPPRLTILREVLKSSIDFSQRFIQHLSSQTPSPRLDDYGIKIESIRKNLKSARFLPIHLPITYTPLLLERPNFDGIKLDIVIERKEYYLYLSFALLLDIEFFLKPALEKSSNSFLDGNFVNFTPIHSSIFKGKHSNLSLENLINLCEKLGSLINLSNYSEVEYIVSEYIALSHFILLNMNDLHSDHNRTFVHNLCGIIEFVKLRFDILIEPEYGGIFTSIFNILDTTLLNQNFLRLAAQPQTCTDPSHEKNEKTDHAKVIPKELIEDQASVPLLAGHENDHENEIQQVHNGTTAPNSEAIISKIDLPATVIKKYKVIIESVIKAAFSNKQFSILQCQFFSDSSELFTTNLEYLDFKALENANLSLVGDETKEFTRKISTIFEKIKLKLKGFMSSGYTSTECKDLQSQLWLQLKEIQDEFIAMTEEKNDDLKQALRIEFINSGFLKKIHHISSFFYFYYELFEKNIKTLLDKLEDVIVMIFENDPFTLPIIIHSCLIDYNEFIKEGFSLNLKVFKLFLSREIMTKIRLIDSVKGLPYKCSYIETLRSVMLPEVFLLEKSESKELSLIQALYYKKDMLKNPHEEVVAQESAVDEHAPSNTIVIGKEKNSEEESLQSNIDFDTLIPLLKLIHKIVIANAEFDINQVSNTIITFIVGFIHSVASQLEVLKNIEGTIPSTGSQLCESLVIVIAIFSELNPHTKCKEMVKLFTFNFINKLLHWVTSNSKDYFHIIGINKYILNRILLIVQYNLEDTDFDKDSGLNCEANDYLLAFFLPEILEKMESYVKLRETNENELKIETNRISLFNENLDNYENEIVNNLIFKQKSNLSTYFSEIVWESTIKILSYIIYSKPHINPKQIEFFRKNLATFIKSFKYILVQSQIGKNISSIEIKELLLHDISSERLLQMVNRDLINLEGPSTIPTEELVNHFRKYLEIIKSSLSVKHPKRINPVILLDASYDSAKVDIHQEVHEKSTQIQIEISNYLKSKSQIRAVQEEFLKTNVKIEKYVTEFMKFLTIDLHKVTMSNTNILKGYTEFRRFNAIFKLNPEQYQTYFINEKKDILRDLIVATTSNLMELMKLNYFCYIPIYDRRPIVSSIVDMIEFLRLLCENHNKLFQFILIKRKDDFFNQVLYYNIKIFQELNINLRKYSFLNSDSTEEKKTVNALKRLMLDDFGFEKLNILKTFDLNANFKAADILFTSIFGFLLEIAQGACEQTFVTLFENKLLFELIEKSFNIQKKIFSKNDIYIRYFIKFFNFIGQLFEESNNPDYNKVSLAFKLNETNMILLLSETYKNLFDVYVKKYLSDEKFRERVKKANAEKIDKKEIKDLDKEYNSKLIVGKKMSSDDIFKLESFQKSSIYKFFMQNSVLITHISNIKSQKGEIELEEKYKLIIESKIEKIDKILLKESNEFMKLIIRAVQILFKDLNIENSARKEFEEFGMDDKIKVDIPKKEDLIPKNESIIKRIYFFRTPDSYYINMTEVLDIVENSTLDMYRQRLIDFLENVSIIQNKVKLTKNLNILESENKIYKLTNKWVSKKAEWYITASVILSILINILVLSFYGVTANKIYNAKAWIIHLLNSTHMLLLTVYLVSFCYLSYKVFEILDNLGISLQKEEEQEEQDEVQGMQNEEKSMLEKLKESFSFKFLVHLCYDISKDTYLHLALWNMLFSMLGYYYPIYFSIQLFSIVFIVSIMKTVIISIQQRWEKFLAMGIMIAITLLIYTFVAYFYFSDRYVDETGDNLCGTPFKCFFHLLNNGLRTGEGLGFKVKTIKDEGYWAEFLFTWIFYFSLTLIMMSIINGIIVDAFQQLRSIKMTREQIKKNNCFVCDLTSTSLEVDGVNFDNHIKLDHSLKDYMIYLINVLMKKESDLTAVESYVYNKYQIKDTSFFPSYDYYGSKNKTAEEN